MDRKKKIKNNIMLIKNKDVIKKIYRLIKKLNLIEISSNRGVVFDINKMDDNQIDTLEEIVDEYMNSRSKIKLISHNDSSNENSIEKLLSSYDDGMKISKKEKNRFKKSLESDIASNEEGYIYYKQGFDSELSLSNIKSESSLSNTESLSVNS